MPLTAKNKANRREMKDRIVTLAESLGARAVAGDDADRCLRVVVQAARGLYVGINLDVRYGHGYRLPWSIDIDHCREVRLSDAFGGVEPRHHLVASHSAEDFDGLLAELDRCIRMANDGTAFRSDKETARLNAESQVRQARCAATAAQSRAETAEV